MELFAESNHVARTYFECLTTHPEFNLDLAVSDALVDIVAEGYDAAIQLGGVIDKDMIALPSFANSIPIPLEGH